MTVQIFQNIDMECDLMYMKLINLIKFNCMTNHVNHKKSIIADSANNIDFFVFSTIFQLHLQ